MDNVPFIFIVILASIVCIIFIRLALMQSPKSFDDGYHQSSKRANDKFSKKHGYSRKPTLTQTNSSKTSNAHSNSRGDGYVETNSFFSGASSDTGASDGGGGGGGCGGGGGE
ncbi:hypothetical protein AB6D11_01035 [Vibrio splendidus]